MRYAFDCRSGVCGNWVRSEEALFVYGVLRFLVPREDLSGIRVLEHKEGAIALTEIPVSSSNSKHIDRLHHCLGKQADRKKIEVE